jgi:gamma-D-glutamyl-L-lysine dipeptidyl-peptidase
MTHGICHVSQIPIRSHPASNAEMVSQLLYGETYRILKSENDWSFIAMDYDGYEGWISNTSIYHWTQEVPRYTQLDILQHTISDLCNQPLCSSMGSQLVIEKKISTQSISEIAKKFLGSPYLWGGRHFSGIDCSGFVQVVYKCVNILLPRDASQQQKQGKAVPFADLFEGDLVFFENNNRVTHVGIFIGDGQIIHAHGMVRMDSIQKEGILNVQTQEQSHTYHSAKRIR